jgi:hypothetical protein
MPKYAAPFDTMDALPNASAVHWATWHKETDELWAVQGDVQQQFARRFAAAQSQLRQAHAKAEAEKKKFPQVPVLGVLRSSACRHVRLC